MGFATNREPSVAIVDFGMGNLHSVARKLETAGAKTTITSDPKLVLAADKLVLPGVGHFGQAMANLREMHLLEALHEAATVKRVPVLGICLGLQLMACRSEEGDTTGLGWIDGDVVRLRLPDPLRFKTPHVGWAGINILRRCPLLQGLSPDAEFYFVHSYTLAVRSPDLSICETEYAYAFPSGIQKDNLFGVQFHPEKSHADGDLVLKNFVEL